MRILAGRHGLSEANDQGSPAFGSLDAVLMDKGRIQAQALGDTLRDQYDIDTRIVHVAVSELIRTQQTAEEAGFPAANIAINPLLNEATKGVPFSEIRKSIAEKHSTAHALVRVEALLANPPEERVWITHGLVIAGLCEVLGLYEERDFVPKFGEIREINI